MINHEWLSGFSASFWPAVADHLWQATMVAGLCLLAFPAFRTAGAKSRHLLWSIAFARFAFPQSLVFLLADLFRFPAADSDGRWQEISATVSAVARPSALVVEQQPAVMDSAATGHTELFCILTTVWIAGIAFFLAGWCLRRHRLAVSLRNSREVGSDILHTLESLKGRLGFSRKIRMRVVWHGSEPGVYGVWRPVLVLPEEMAHQLRPAEAEAVLAHELVHVFRQDNLWSSFQMLICSIFWFYPVVWLIDRRLIAERERFCDERVIGALGNPQAYVSGLTKIASIGLGFRLAGVSPMTGANLQGRIRHMMNTHKKTSLPAKFFLTSIALLAVLLCLMAAPLPRSLSQAAPNILKIENAQGSPLQIESAYIEDISVPVRGSGDLKPRLVKPKIVVKNRADKAIAVYELELKKPGSDSVFLVRNPSRLAAKSTEVIDLETIEKQATTIRTGSPAEKSSGGTSGFWTVHVIMVRFENGQVATLHPMSIPAPSAQAPGGVVGGMRGNLPGGSVPPPSPPRQMKGFATQAPSPINAGSRFPESKRIRRVEPVYPESALKAGVQGRVILVIHVDEEGNVTDAKVQNGHPTLDEAAVAAVKQWKYSPTFLNGKPVPVIATVSVDFNLK